MCSDCEIGHRLHRRNLTLRIEPLEDARYAHRWDNPSTDSTRDTSGSVLGANALAVFGLAMLSTVPAAFHEARTVGFVGRGARATYWRWPIWAGALNKEVVRSLLSHPQLVEEGHCKSLKGLGVLQVYQSQRLTVGNFRNFTPARRIA